MRKIKFCELRDPVHKRGLPVCDNPRLQTGSPRFQTGSFANGVPGHAPFCNFANRWQPFAHTNFCELRLAVCEKESLPFLHSDGFAPGSPFAKLWLAVCERRVSVRETISVHSRHDLAAHDLHAQSRCNLVVSAHNLGAISVQSRLNLGWISTRSQRHLGAQPRRDLSTISAR